MLRTLDILIGTTIVLLIFSMAVTVITQAITVYFGRKGKHLKSGLSDLIRHIGIPDRVLTDKIAHALLTGPMMADVKGKLGTVISREEFTKLLLDFASGQGSLDQDARTALVTMLKANGISDPAATLKNVRAMALQLEASNPELANDVRQSLAILHTAASDYVAKINSSFDQTIDRVSERFTKYTHAITVGIAAAVVLTVQLDTIAVVNRLSIDEQFRNTFVQSATKDYSKEALPSTADPLAQPGASSSSLPVGNTVPNVAPGPYYDLLSKAGLITMPTRGWFQQMSDVRKYPGMLLSILLLSLGAPFWFAILKDLLGLRSALAQKDDVQRMIRQTTQDVQGGTVASASNGAPAVPALPHGEIGDFSALG